MGYHPAPYMPRAKVTGAPAFDNLMASVALAPALSDLRNARNSVEAMSAMDLIPEHLYVPIIEQLTSRNLFTPEVVRTVIQIVGFDTLVRAFGTMRANAIKERFGL